MHLARLLRSNALASLRSESSPLQKSLTSQSWRRRQLSTESTLDSLPGLDPSKLKVTDTITPKELVPHQDLVFGRTFTGTLSVHVPSTRDAILTFLLRPHAIDRMDCLRWLARTQNNTLPKPLTRPSQLRPPLCLHLF